MIRHTHVAFQSARFILIAYIASGHFIHTATKNPFLLRMITQDLRGTVKATSKWRLGQF